MVVSNILTHWIQSFKFKMYKLHWLVLYSWFSASSVMKFSFAFSQSAVSNLCRNVFCTHYYSSSSWPRCSTSHQPSGSADWSIDHLAAVSYTSHQSFDLLKLWEWPCNPISIEPQRQESRTPGSRKFLLPGEAGTVNLKIRPDSIQSGKIRWAIDSVFS